MKPPHWLKHTWGPWVPVDAPHSEILGYDFRVAANDIRTCTSCGRRQMRSI